MTDVLGPQKVRMRRFLVDSCFTVLERDGWEISKVSGFGNSRIRRIAKDGTSKLAAIRTTQDLWIAFPRTKDDARWATLSDVDVVVVAAVDPDDSKFARIHMMDATELRGRFDRAYAARIDAGYNIPFGARCLARALRERSLGSGNASRRRCRHRERANRPCAVGCRRRAIG